MSITFQKLGDEDDITSTDVIIFIITYNTVFDKLSVNHVFENIDKIPSTIVFSEPEVLDAIVLFYSNNLSTSNRSNKRDDVYHAPSLDEYTIQFITNNSLCNVKSNILNILQNH